MIYPSREYRLGPITLTSTIYEVGVEEPQERTATSMPSRVSQVGVWILYGVLIALALLYLLYTLVPFYLSGFQNLSIDQIERSGLSLWDFDEYPLYAFGGTGLAQITWWLCPLVGFPLFLGLVAELIRGWSRSSHRSKVLKLSLVILPIVVGVLSWLVPYELGFLLWD